MRIWSFEVEECSVIEDYISYWRWMFRGWQLIIQNWSIVWAWALIDYSSIFEDNTYDHKVYVLYIKPNPTGTFSVTYLLINGNCLELLSRVCTIVSETSAYSHLTAIINFFPYCVLFESYLNKLKVATSSIFLDKSH